MTDLQASSETPDRAPRERGGRAWIRFTACVFVVPMTFLSLLIVWHFHFSTFLHTGLTTARLLGVTALMMSVCLAVWHALGLVRPARAVRWWLAITMTAVVISIHVAVSQGTFLLPHVQKYFRDLNLTFSFWVLLIWIACLSGMRWTRRAAALGGVFALVAVLAGLFRFEGIGGDGDPLFIWRFRTETQIVARAPDSDRLSDRLSDGLGDINQANPAISGVTDYPGFLGPNRDATLSDMRLSRDWTARPPVLVWRRPVGAGWGAFAVAGHRAITQEQDGPNEAVVCYQLRSGKVIWRHGDEAQFVSAATGDGPRATPTIAGGRVYTLGGTGILNCLDESTGDSIWMVDTLRDNDAAYLLHGISGSPLVVGEVVVVCAGGTDGRSLVAYDRKTGRRVYSAGSAPAAYTSPQLSRVCGQPQILIHNAGGLFAHDPDDGRILWHFPWMNDSGTNCTQPVVFDDGTDRVLAVTGQGEGCAMFRVSRQESGDWTTDELWTSRRLHSKFANVVVRDNHAYGLDNGILVCLDLEDGRRCWKRGRYGHGQLLLIGDLLLIQAEGGDIVLVEATPEEHRELTRFTALSAKTWNHPALAGKFLLVRNDREAACYKLPLDSSSIE